MGGLARGGGGLYMPACRSSIVLDLLNLISAAPLVAVMAVVVQLRGRFFVGTGEGAAVVSVAELYYIRVGRRLGEAAVQGCSPLGDVVVTWIAVLPFTGLCGYCLRARYIQADREVRVYDKGPSIWMCTCIPSIFSFICICEAADYSIFSCT